MVFVQTLGNLPRESQETTGIAGNLFCQPDEVDRPFVIAAVGIFDGIQLLEEMFSSKENSGFSECQAVSNYGLNPGINTNPNTTLTKVTQRKRATTGHWYYTQNCSQ